MFGTFEILVDVQNAAFEPDPATETARLLRTAADRVERGSTDGTLLDVNGNRVGSYGFVTVRPGPLTGVNTLADALDDIGVTGTVARGTRAPVPASFVGSTGWTVTLTGPDGTGLVFPFWTGSGIVNAPTVADAVSSILLDVSYVSEIWGGPELDRDTVETIETRGRWFRRFVDEPTFDRLIELASEL